MREVFPQIPAGLQVMLCGRGDDFADLKDVSNSEYLHMIEMEQVHAAGIAIVHRTAPEIIPGVDALITQDSNTMLIVRTADCVPGVLFDLEHQVLAVFHAGWRGTSNGIAFKTVLEMQMKYGTKPENVWAGIGPAIGDCCYQVGKEVTSALGKWISSDIIESGYVDLKKINHQQLTDCGVLNANIKVHADCTKCTGDRWYSHRQDGTKKRNYLAAWIKGNNV